MADKQNKTTINEMWRRNYEIQERLHVEEERSKQLHIQLEEERNKYKQREYEIEQDHLKLKENIRNLFSHNENMDDLYNSTDLAFTRNSSKINKLEEQVELLKKTI